MNNNIIEYGIYIKAKSQNDINYWNKVKHGLVTVGGITLPSKPHGNDVHVRAYDKSDGTHVRDYNRSYPNR